MSLYSEKLAHLKKEIACESLKRKKKKKKFTSNQKIMINFINGVTSEAIFNILNKSVILRKGDSNKGFVHIIENHYGKGSRGEINMLDLLNFDLYLQRALKLSSVGVSNPNLDVYQYIKGINNYKIILKKDSDKNLTVSFYKVD